MDRLLAPSYSVRTPSGVSAHRRVVVLKALAHPTRLLLTEALMQGELCVNALRELAGVDVSTVSKHLSVLKGAGVLHSQKRGLNVYYNLACDCFGEFLQCVDQVCPSPAPNGLRGAQASACC